ncbi:L-threonylcarbamoyladenylate synthase [Arsenicicoccus piscis]
MSERIDCTSPEGRAAGVAAAVAAVRAGEVVVLPTDTVYGIGADAFSPEAVTRTLAAKGRDRDMPPPVLIPSARTVDGLATSVPTYARDLMEQFWPGPLTLVLLAQPSLMWDLGETNGTVALRIPQDEIALAVLTEVGPMAVTSANRSGEPAAVTIEQAQEQLGDAVAVYLDGGPSVGGWPRPSSTAPRTCRGCCAPARSPRRTCSGCSATWRSAPTRTSRPEVGRCASTCSSSSSLRRPPSRPPRWCGRSRSGSVR